MNESKKCKFIVKEYSTGEVYLSIETEGDFSAFKLPVSFGIAFQNKVNIKEAENIARTMNNQSPIFYCDDLR